MTFFTCLNICENPSDLRWISCCVRSFCWEEVPARGGLAKLLAAGAQGHLKLLEVDAEGGASVSLLWECSADQLLEVVREHDHGERLVSPPRRHRHHHF